MTRKAVVVGVDQYDDSRIHSLNYAAQDAQKMSDFLSLLPPDVGFETTTLFNPTAFEVCRIVEKQSAFLKKDDLFFFYFAGHGYLQKVFGQYLLLCRDAFWPSVCHYGTNGSVQHEFLNTITKDCPANMVFCFDVCRAPLTGYRETDMMNGTPFLLEIGSSRSRNPGERIRRSALYTTMWACSDGQMSMENEQLNGGVFTSELLIEMKARLKKKRNILFNTEFQSIVSRNVGMSASRSNPVFKFRGGAPLLFAELQNAEENQDAEEPQNKELDEKKKNRSSSSSSGSKRSKDSMNLKNSNNIETVQKNSADTENSQSLPENAAFLQTTYSAETFSLLNQNNLAEQNEQIESSIQIEQNIPIEQNIQTEQNIKNGQDIQDEKNDQTELNIPKDENCPAGVSSEDVLDQEIQVEPENLSSAKTAIENNAAIENNPVIENNVAIENEVLNAGKKEPQKSLDKQNKDIQESLWLLKGRDNQTLSVGEELLKTGILQGKVKPSVPAQKSGTRFWTPVGQLKEFRSLFYPDEKMFQFSLESLSGDYDTFLQDDFLPHTVSLKENQSDFPEIDRHKIPMVLQIPDQVDSALMQYRLGLCFYHGYGVAENKQTANEWFLRAAEQNFAPAQFVYGESCIKGNGVPKSREKGIEFLKKSAEQNDPYALFLTAFLSLNERKTKNEMSPKIDQIKQVLPILADLAERNSWRAQIILSLIYQTGIGVEKDMKISFRWTRQVAMRGSSDAQYNVGWCYENGNGTEISLNAAFRWYHISAELGDSVAQCKVGRAYLYGSLTKKDEKLGTNWLQKASDQNEISAQVELGVCCLKGIGVEKNPEKSRQLLEKAAEKGSRDALFQLGRFYHSGATGTKDYDKAFQYYLRAAELACPEAQYYLGHCLETGRGTLKDQTQAFQWFLKAAENGYTPAQNKIAGCYMNGDLVKKDKTAAAQWYLKAAKAGNADAQFFIGLCYENGDGVEKDEQQAIKWFQVSAGQGNDEAQKALSHHWFKK